MMKCTSAGIVALSKEDGHEWKVLLIHHRGYEKFWSCPKGHIEPQETEAQAAQRELKEETNLDIVRFLQQEPIIEEFCYTKNERSISKKVAYFVAEVTGELIIQDEEEIAGSKWVSLPEALELIAHPTGRETIRAVQEILESTFKK